MIAVGRMPVDRASQMSDMWVRSLRGTVQLSPGAAKAYTIEIEKENLAF
jgi:hypothetical protein